MNLIFFMGRRYVGNMVCFKSHDSIVNWEKIEKCFSIFEFRLGINFSLFRLGHFEQVEERLGSPGAGVEIDTG